MRIFCAGIGTETNTFSPLPTGLASFLEREYFPSGQHPEHASFVGCPLYVARKQAATKGWTLFEGLVTSAQPGGITSRSAYETLRDELLSDLQDALPIDVVVLGLHGAMVAEGYDDCEGDILTRVRAIVGPNTIIGAELDPHAHLTKAMVEQVDILIAFKEYPHTDGIARAEELLNLCEKAYKGQLKFSSAIVDCDMIVPIHTTREPAQSFIQKIKNLEQGAILSISLIHGFALGDVADMGTKVLVYSDGDAAMAQALAEELAAELIAMRSELMVPYMSIEQALEEAVKLKEFPVVMADRADNPGSGAPGDATFVLRYLLEQDVSSVALGPLWDPVAVSLAFNAGIDTTLPMRIGGKVGPLSGEPLDVVSTVLAVHEDLYMTSLSGGRIRMGACALIRVGGVEVLLTSIRNQAMNIDVFTQLGCDLTKKKIIVVKSAQHFYASFSEVAKAVFYIGGRGVATPDWWTLSYNNISRPKWPL